VLLARFSTFGRERPQEIGTRIERLKESNTKSQLNDTGDVGCIQSFGALLADKFHGIAFVERFVAVLLYGGKVDEDIFAARPLNETVSFSSVEPLYDALFFHMTSPCLLYGAISDLSAESFLLWGGLTRISSS
jgi:hypothetical protein